jgi:hypothetical protein
MLYHAIHLDGKAVVRPMTDGISDAEWFHGCRCIEHSLSEYKLTQSVKDKLDVLTKEQWSELISSLDEPGNVPSNRFISTRYVPDKWDADRTIY